MDDLWLPLTVLSRWLHIGTAIVLLGGSIFLRYVMMPAAAGLPETDHAAFRDRLMGRWRKFVSAGIGLLLLSGGYNYLAVAIPAHKGDGAYHGLVGTKILLAFVVFFLASALAGKAKAFNAIREGRRKWLAVVIAFSAVIVAISGYVKIAHPGKPAAPNAMETLDDPADAPVE
jgi:uncharacterized membrane protein